MTVKEQIKKYIAGQPEPKLAEIQELHRRILRAKPASKLWFSMVKNSENKTVANPTIGYGSYTIKYADGSTKEYFRIGLLANSTGISVHILGIKEKTFLAKKFGKDLGKASMSGYCIKFKTIKDINVDVLEAAILHGLGLQDDV
ncbi:MAG: DUF1801 domain-containing protein [Bacteroidota bacterium]